MQAIRLAKQSWVKQMMSRQRKMIRLAETIALEEADERGF
jgi:hypothetical protein